MPRCKYCGSDPCRNTEGCIKIRAAQERDRARGERRTNAHTLTNEFRTEAISEFALIREALKAQVVALHSIANALDRVDMHCERISHK